MGILIAEYDFMLLAILHNVSASIRSNYTMNKRVHQEHDPENNEESKTISTYSVSYTVYYTVNGNDLKQENHSLVLLNEDDIESPVVAIYNHLKTLYPGAIDN